MRELRHDDAGPGSTGLKAANGAWDVLVIDEGVTVDTSTTPWTISARSTGVRASATTTSAAATSAGTRAGTGT